MKLNVLSLFDGASCARVAIEKNNIEVDRYFASEVDEPAIRVAGRAYPDTFHIGDVRHVYGNEKEERPQYIFTDLGNDNLQSHFTGGIDLLIGGSPCQDLSIAKKGRKGLEGEKSSLFWEYVRILREVKPRYFILENVASMPKEARQVITETLGVEPIMIDAALVSAQTRKRLFWTNIPNVSQPEDRGIILKDILEKEVDEKYFISEERLAVILEKMRQGRPLPQSQRIYNTDGKSVALQAGGGGLGAKTGLYIIVPEATKKGYAVAEDGDSIDLSFPTSTTRRGRVGKKVKNLMTSQNIAVFTTGRVRRLTPTECERLQGLKDGHTAGESDAQRYKICGNAFNADVIAHILSFIPKK